MLILSSSCFLPQLIFSDSNPEYFQDITTSVNPKNIALECGDIFELTFQHSVDYADKFFDVSLRVIFTSPEGAEQSIDGFYYASDLWKIRFLPEMPGTWDYRYEFSNKYGYKKEGAGSFNCSMGDFKGKIEQNPGNPYRWVFANGEPYFPIGIQDCISHENGVLTNIKIDGESRNDGTAISVSRDEYLSLFGQSGFNLIRFSPNNCSYPLFDEPDQFILDASLATDEILSLARKHNFKVMFGLFGFYDRHNLLDIPLLLKELKYIKYCVARWGIYVDFWEILNESKASNIWILAVANYLQVVDNSDKPLSTSWEKGRLPLIDIYSPHWYESEDESISDLRVHQQAVRWKQYHRPVIVGEQGNSGMNWDPTSGLRMRIRTWTALFEELSFIFWNTSYAKNGVHQGIYTPGRASNIYLGPEERKYIKILNEFSSHLDADIKMIPIDVSYPEDARAYGLSSDHVTAIYIHHFSDHSTNLEGLQVFIDLPYEGKESSKWTCKWIQPSTGKIIDHVTLDSGINWIETPSFRVDIALLCNSQ